MGGRAARLPGLGRRSQLAQKGDLLYKKGGLQRRCIVVANDGTNVTTVNGNGVAQAIHVQTLPVSEYHGFHDVLKATPEQSRRISTIGGRR